ncbi:hypothetical protein [Streptomyces roseoviridis]|uniref:MarR family transcriptional regulator n=1 Tax=Streptomyces roseoviridis TaxID=67361 RepID=A0ABV5QTT5_9ACTN
MSQSVTSAPSPALTSFDHRIELAVGFSIDRLWHDHDHGLLDEQTARLAAAHRTLSDAERGVTFYRVLLQRLASGDHAIDESLFPRIDRTVEQLKQAVTCRKKLERDVADALEPIDARAVRNPAAHTELKAREIALLLAISQGAKLYEHLLTQRLSVTTASGTRVTQQDCERLEQAGLIQRDESRPLHAGQPVTLTDAGRSALSTRPSDRFAAGLAARPGSWPATSRTRR